MNLIARAAIQIQKPADEVFEAIVNPEHMSRYFISESTGRMENGGSVVWKFPEFPDHCPVNFIKAEPHHHYVSFVWDPETIVTIVLESQADGSTVVRVTEDGKPNTEENLKWAIGNTEGWANFLACMKAWLEYGIMLRKGAFDFMRTS